MVREYKEKEYKKKEYKSSIRKKSATPLKMMSKAKASSVAPRSLSIASSAVPSAPPSSASLSVQAAPSPAPTSAQPATPATPAQPAEPGRPEVSSGGSGTVTITVDVDHEDYTQLPGELDGKFEALDEDSALRSTILKPDQTWTKSYQTALLAAPSKKTMYTADLEEEKKKAYDLLDCLSRSGV
jgi:hypothetical protein